MPPHLPVNLHEYEDAALAVLPRPHYDFIAGGASDAVTLRENRAAFDRWRLLPRALRGVGTPDLATTVLGQPVSLPVLFAPIGLQRLAHAEGEVATARAARRAGTIFIFSTAGSRTIEEVAADAGAWWFQLYVTHDRGLTRELIRRAEAGGASALVITIDVPPAGRREADVRHDLRLPPDVDLANFRGAVPASTAADAAGVDPGSPVVNRVTAWMEPALTWRDIEWVASQSSLPLLIKGILAPEDARLAIDRGARGIIVSNHGGRQLDEAVAALDALPAIVQRVAGRAEVILDGGIRRAADVLKALALGARAVCLGRPYMWGLAVDGEGGALRVVELLRAEMSTDMILCGRESIAAIDGSLVVPAGILLDSPRHG